MDMKALLKLSREEETLHYRNIPVPSPAADELLIRIHYAGICGTDLHILKNEYEANAPVVLGHEYSGVVAQVGEAVTDFAPGDRVVSLTAAVTCGHCRYCRDELLMLCDHRKSIGSGINGAFAEYMVLPARLAMKLPDNVPLKEAALCEPLACVVRGVSEQCRVDAGDHVLVCGPGTIGLLTLQVAAANGGRVMVCGTRADEERLRTARQLGAAAVLYADDPQLTEKIRDFAGPDGFDVVFECAGAAPSASLCLRLVRKRGRYAQLGLYGRPIPFDFDLMLKKEIFFSSSFAQERSSWRTTLRLLEQKRVDLSPLISDVIPMSDWRRAFDKALNREGYKILLLPGE